MKKNEELFRGRTLLVGDSLFDFWKNDYRNALQGMPDLDNIAVGGTNSVYWCQNAKLIRNAAPNTLIISVGTNNIGDLRWSGQKTVEGKEGIQEMLETFHAVTPQAHIYLLTINICGEKGRWDLREEIKISNKLMRAYCDKKQWVDIVETEYAFYDDNNYADKPNPEYFVPDYLHFSAKGYTVLGEILRKALGLELISKKVQETNAYIAANQNKTVDIYRGKYHLTSPIGWINDPNGFIFFNGKYHLFYQYNPYGLEVDHMCWGHTTSDDLIKWEHHGVVIAPDREYDKSGCWSGSAIVRDNRLYIIYTGHFEENGVRIETQNLAWSDNGTVFHKYEGNPVIGVDLVPEGTSVVDFRDPYIWEHEGMYYLLVGTMEQGAAKVLLYRSKDLFHWNFLNTFLRREHAGFCWECPSFASVNGVDLLVLSPVDYPAAQHAFHNFNSSVYATGKVRYPIGIMEASPFAEVDYGLDFYAPQLTTHDGETVMIAWMNLWARSYPTKQLDHGWTGSLTLPRTITVKDGKLYQKPVKGLENYCSEPVKVTDTLIGTKEYSDIGGDCLRLKVRADMRKAKSLTISFFVGEGVHTDLTYSRETGVATLDRTHSGIKIAYDARETSQARIRTAAYHADTLTLEIYLDKCSAEIFFGEGDLVMTTLSYNPPDATHITFTAEGEVSLVLEQSAITL